MTFRAQRNNSFQGRFDTDFDALQLPKAASQRGSRRGIDAPRHLHAGRTRRRASAGAAAAMRNALNKTRRHGNGARRPEAPERSVQTKTIIGTELPPRPKLRGTTRRLVSQKFGGLRRFHAIFMNRLRERRRWVVSFPILRPFGPRRFRPHTGTEGFAGRSPTSS